MDRLLADYRYKILRLQREEEEALGAGADEFASETGAADAEDAAISSVSVALPEERRRIKELLAKYPPQRETKVEKLIGALGVLVATESAGADGRVRHVSRQRRDARRGN